MDTGRAFGLDRAARVYDGLQLPRLGGLVKRSGIGVLLALSVLIVWAMRMARPHAATLAASTQPAPLSIDYPADGSIFPPDFAPPTFLWRDASPGVAEWRIEVQFSDGAQPWQTKSAGEPMRIGEIDPRAVATTNEPPMLTPEQAASHAWKPEPAAWAAIKRHSVDQAATLTITGWREGQPVSTGSVKILTSRDPVGAPIFYRDVPLAPSDTEKGVIKPLATKAIPLIAWRLRSVSETGSHLLLTGMHTCANCHSFSLDGKTLGMDLDGPGNDKGLYALAAVRPRMSIRNEDMITWRAPQDRQASPDRVGFMSQVSPNGQYVLTRLSGLGATLRGSYYVVNFEDYHFLQVFYPTRGILAWYDRAAGRAQPLPGADDPQYTQTDGVWSPDGRTIVFARAEAKDPYLPGVKLAQYANDPNEAQIQYDLYRVPFNGGKGGHAEPIAGAHGNGMSNNFPKVSPDGRWIVFVQCRNGQLMRPDSQLWIVPSQGGQARRMRCNTPLMNSWHSFSPNGRWLVFSSKSRGPYTKMFLTHIDQDGNDSPAILIEDATAANRAVNIPEFVNIPPDGLEKIDVPAADFYNQFDIAFDLMEKHQYQAAIPEWNKAVALDPKDVKAHIDLGMSLAETGHMDAAMEQYRKARVLDPQNPDVYSHLAAALSRAGKPDQAIPYFETALKLTPQDAKLHNSLGLALASAGRSNDAIAHYEKARSLAPADPEAYTNLGVALARSGKPDEAIPVLEKALELDPANATAEGNLGAALAQKGRTADAIAHCQKALELSPEDAQAHANLAIALTAAGRQDDALAHLEKASQLAPSDAGIHSNFGAALAAKGNVAQAVPHFEKALAIDPSNAQAEVNLAIALNTLGKSNEAIAHLEKAVRLLPGDAVLQSNLGGALVARGKIDEAVPHFEKALAISPDFTDARFNLGALYQMQGRTRSALVQWRKLLAAQPDFVPALNATAQVLSTNPDAALRNGGEAVALAERAVKLSAGREPVLLDTLAAAYAEMGRYADAAKTARDALDLASGQGNQQLADGLKTRLGLYQAKTPFRVQPLHSP